MKLVGRFSVDASFLIVIYMYMTYTCYNPTTYCDILRCLYNNIDPVLSVVKVIGILPDLNFGAQNLLTRRNPRLRFAKGRARAHCWIRYKRSQVFSTRNRGSPGPQSDTGSRTASQKGREFKAKVYQSKLFFVF